MSRRNTAMGWLCMVATLTLISCLQHVSAADNKTSIDGVGFSGSALLFIYHVGVASELVKANAYELGVTPVAGTSGGSYMAAAMTTGTTPDQLYTAVEQMYEEMYDEEQACMKANPEATPQDCAITNGKLAPYQYKLLSTIIPSTDAWEQAQGTAYVHIALVTSDIPYEPYPKALCDQAAVANLTVSNFTSRSDLISACLASSYFSYVAAPNCATRFRGQAAIDGGYALHLPCPPDSTHCLRVEALMPYNAEEQKKCSGEVVPGTAPACDIYPGYSGVQLPLNYCDWGSAAVNVTLIHQHYKAIYAVGQADARKWLQDNGWA